MKYSDYFIDSLAELGYTHCFFVGGGNVMHLLESARTRMKCIAVVHEVSAGIAAEYFNVAKRNSNERAFAMVTAGPGATNIVSAIGAAWLESRELLVVGGQARTEFLSGPDIRQIGHQEIDGQAIVKPITKLSKRIEKPIGIQEIKIHAMPSDATLAAQYTLTSGVVAITGGSLTVWYTLSCEEQTANLKDSANVSVKNSTVYYTKTLVNI